MLQITPKTISDIVIDFCAEIVNDPKPIYLKVEPFEEAVVNECYENVRKYINNHGGSIQYGWQIWEWPNVMIEAEFHAVWVSESGEYKEVTLKDFNIGKILFLSDPDRKYEGKQINNIRKALKESKAIRDFIDCSNKLFELQNVGELSTYQGLIIKTPKMQEVEEKMKSAFLRILEEEKIKPEDII